MQIIALTRTAHVLPYVREAGASRFRLHHELRSRSLPALLEEEFDGFMPKVPFFECLHAVAQQGGVRDLGYAAFRRWRLSCLDRDVLSRVRNGATLAARFSIFADVGRIEDTQLDMSLRVEGHATRIILSRGERAYKGFEYGEWTQIAASLSIVRDATALRVQPQQLTLQARYRPCEEACNEFRGGIVVGAPHTSIVLPTSVFEMRLASQAVDPLSLARTEQVLSELRSGRLAPRLKLILRSYLREGYPPIGLAAELARTSVRSLQRELARSQVSYSDLVQQVRFEQAARLLAQERAKVIDVALSLGYEDASHFSRAFKRVTGVSPRQYRTQSGAAHARSRTKHGIRAGTSSLPMTSDGLIR